MVLQLLTTSLHSDINTRKEYFMATLSLDDMRKNASGGAYAGTKRPDIFDKKIKDGKSFRLGASKNGKEIIGLDYDKKTELLTYYIKTDTSKNPLTAKRSEVFKDSDFGGGSGSGGGADDTKYTESLQCYYCSYVFNTIKKPINGTDKPTDAQLKAAGAYAHTDVTLAECLAKGPSNWIETEVYIKTANKLFGSVKFDKTPVHFHRGSAFMKGVYAAYKDCKAKDQANENTQAPGSFSDDKWNPGDIWASTFSTTSTPLAAYTDSWGTLNAKVLELGGGGTKRQVKLLGISLKKVTSPSASIQEFSTEAQKAQRETYEWQSWSWGKTGKFFDSQDIYAKISGKEVQFRTFGGDTSWQGEVKGTSAAGGKIGGGNVNFYAKKIFSKDIYNGKSGRTAEKQFLTEITADQNKLNEKLYAGYIRHNANSSPKVTEIPKNEFMELVKGQDSNFKNSKIICINFLDAVYTGTSTSRNQFATDLFRYASSDTDQSSYFVKLY